MIEILLVDDDPGDVRLTVEALKQTKMHINLTFARDGIEALAFQRREGKFGASPCPDIILLDLNMPRKDGRKRHSPDKKTANRRTP
jgi:two-component system, chemotaxis family, response regulator Rcp1